MPEGDDGEAGDGANGPRRLRPSGKGLAPRDHLRLEPGRLRRQLPVLPHRQTRPAAQPDAQAKSPGRSSQFLIATVSDVGRDRVNLVFMGMGEPFLNYDNFMAAVRLLVDEVGLSPQRMTVSTSGIVPGIERFAEEPPDVRPKLAISLNAPNDEVRSRDHAHQSQVAH